MQVKGSIFVEFVKVIRANKSGDFEKYLTEADRKIISQQILPNIWYPYETFKHCLTAVFEVIAKKDLETAKEWGRLYAHAIMGDIYKGMLKPGAPLSFLKKVVILGRNFFDSGSVESVSIIADNQVVYKMAKFDPQFAPIHYMLLGWMERSTEMCGAKNLNSEMLTKSWEGGADTSVRLTWTL
jgi:hypothetical protein